MNKTKAIESVSLALEALRDLEDATHTGDQRTINLKIEVLRGTLFTLLELIQADEAE